MGHKQTKEKRESDESDEEKKAKEQFHQLADEIINAALALKDHFTEPIDESIINECDEIRMKLYRIGGPIRVLKQNGFSFDEDNQGPAVLFIGELFEMRFFGRRREPDDPNLVQLVDIVDKIKREERILAYRREIERESHLYDVFEAVYNNSNDTPPTQEELDEAYFSFGREVNRFLFSITAEYRPGSYREMDTWFSKEAEIEAEFKKRFPKYKPPCSLNQAEHK